MVSFCARSHAPSITSIVANEVAQAQGPGVSKRPQLHVVDDWLCGLLVMCASANGVSGDAADTDPGVLAREGLQCLWETAHVEGFGPS